MQSARIVFWPGAGKSFHTYRKRMRVEEKPTGLCQVEADGCDRAQK